MALVIIVITILFTCSAFFFTLPQQTTANLLLLYYFLQQNFVVKNYLFFVAGFIVLVFIFFRFNFDKKYSSLKIFFFSTIQVITVVSIGFFISYVMLLLIAFVELNIFSVLINNNPKMLGIVADKQTIANVFKANRSSPEIIVSDQKGVVTGVAKATSGTTNFYGKYSLSAIPNFFILPVNKSLPPMMLLDNTLIITEINQRDMQEVGAYLGYLFVKSYFPTRNSKAFPTLSVMNKEEYEQHRKQDALEKLVKIDDAIKKIDGYISSLSAAMKQDRRKDPAKQELLDEYNYYFDFYKTQREKVKTLSQHVPHELGVFVPTSTVRIVFTTENSHSLGDYIETLTHEYLHYASYVSDNRRFSSAFFEEGLTEYFAREIVKENLHISTNLGYPVQVAIIQEMTKMIIASEFADIYFAKDEDALEKALDRVYGDNFYENNFILFESLQYASDKKQILKLANEIMKRIGGKALTEKDLVSTYSNL